MTQKEGNGWGFYRLSLSRKSILDYNRDWSPARLIDTRFAEALDVWPRASERIVRRMLSAVF